MPFSVTHTDDIENIVKIKNTIIAKTGARYFANIFEAFHDIRYLWNPFGIMAIIILLEIIFRVKNIIDIICLQLMVDKH